jgi:hypothetical protein
MYLVGMVNVITTAGGTGEGAACVAMDTVVGVTGNRGSVVIVGTGDKRTDCMVEMRSRAEPVAGISMMICLRISSSMCGTVGWRSRL